MRSPKKHAFSKSRIHSKFKVKNCSEYNDILRRRGRPDVMIAEDFEDGWEEELAENKKPGRQRQYSDKAILRCLEIRCLFRLKLRQTEGFINYIFEISGLNIKCPDYTTLSKRGAALEIEIVKDVDKEFTHVSLDSTGVQTFTGNEWLENKHGKRYKRRIWKKLHIAVDAEGNILANSTTSHTEDDRSQIDILLASIKTNEVLGDPGYDGESTYQRLRKKGIKPTIRPLNAAVASKAENLKTERDKSAEYQQEKGYQTWRVKNNYGRRERVENTFFRFKTTFGSQFLSRSDENMENEMTIKCQLLNKMFAVGKPISVRAA